MDIAYINQLIEARLLKSTTTFSGKMGSWKGRTAEVYTPALGYRLGLHPIGAGLLQFCRVLSVALEFYARMM